MYKEEIQLVKKFRKTISKNTASINLTKTDVEFQHITGRTDVIGISENGELVAIEAKLKNWKAALHQAYRSTSFAHYSYVLLPSESIKIAIKNKEEFTKRKVGLLTIENDEITIVLEAEKSFPFIPRLTREAIKLLEN